MLTETTNKHLKLKNMKSINKISWLQYRVETKKRVVNNYTRAISRISTGQLETERGQHWYSICVDRLTRAKAGIIELETKIDILKTFRA